MPEMPAYRIWSWRNKGNRKFLD